MNNRRVTDQMADILQEQKKFHKNLYNSHLQMENMSYDPQYAQVFCPQYDDIPMILEEDRMN